MATLTPRNVLPVLVVGSLNMDFIGIVKKHTARRYHQHFDNDLQRPGGHGANQAVAVHRASHCKPESGNDGFNARGSWIGGQPAPTYSLDFDIQVSLVGMVGDESDHGELIKKELENNHVNTKGVDIAKGFKTGFAHIHVNAEGVPEVSTAKGANGQLTPDKIKSWSPAPAMVLVQLEIPVDTVQKVIDQANTQKIPIVFNPAPFDEKNNLHEHIELFKVDHLILNAICTDQILNLPELTEHEFLDFERRSEMQKRYIDACNAFHNWGAGCVVITLGSLGAIASYLEPKDTRGSRNQKIWIFGAKEGANPLVDETGASDAFIGTYAVEILRQSRLPSGVLDIGAAIEVAIKAGGLTVSAYGSLDAIPWRNEIFAPDSTFTNVSPFEFEEET
ncbi:Ribokinase-like protein [Hyaloscypha variabilis F]|jgi:ribokinase|uniref:Ribokinase-like protein n=1 Tax=Hyaloscypha variabilis (strain UAMH 11265 / GT02V1 / F) TaxID=1149755 RepID=A0A2J6QVG8_HYAVF|nr:Ribokinase-like protein [Hyaloscypha variabilis F]